MYRLQRLECFIDMSLRGVLREEDVTHNALSVDDIGHAPRQSESCGHPIALSDDAPHVAQQDEREPVLFGESLVGLQRIGADPDHFRSSVLEDLVVVPKGPGLVSTDGSVIPRIEVQHDIRLTKKVLQAY